MKRLVYLAVLSMAIMVISAPAALAQQGNALCQGATAVDSFSGTTTIDETTPFNIDTDTFQVAVETTPTNNSDSAFTSVFVDDSNFTTLTSQDFSNILPEDSLSGVIPVDNNGAGPFTLSILPSEASYDITVYECGAANVDNSNMDNDADNNGVVDGEETNPAGDVNGDEAVNMDDDLNGDGAVNMGDDMDNNGIVNEGDAGNTAANQQQAQQPAADQYADDGATDDGATDDGGVTALPDTGGPSILLVGATLLMGGGVLGLLALRSRTE